MQAGAARWSRRDTLDRSEGGLMSAAERATEERRRFGLGDL